MSAHTPVNSSQASPGQSDRPLLEVTDLHVTFTTDVGQVHAVRGVSLQVNPGEVLAVVGESGSGKSVTIRSIMGLLARSARIDQGSIRYKGRQLLGLPDRQMRALRGKDIALVFQDPMTCLDPTMTIGKQVAEGLRLHTGASRSAARKAALDMLDRVGIADATRRMHHYPHQFSGGQRQRIAIAIALICQPAVLLADEPTTALDVRVQAQILDLLRELRQQSSAAMILVTHDLGVVATVADRIAVMYAGKVVEEGTTREVFGHPQHPYTWGLLGSLPRDGERLTAIPGTPPSLINPPIGDAFAPRNAYALPRDFVEEPPFFTVSPTHRAATWLLSDDSPRIEPPAGIAQRWANWHALHPDGSACRWEGPRTPASGHLASPAQEADPQ